MPNHLGQDRWQVGKAKLTSDRGDTRVDRSMLVMQEIIDSQVKHTDSLFDLPYSSRLVSRSRDEVLAVSRKVERVYFLHVALKQVPDSFCFDIPNLGINISQGGHVKEESERTRLRSNGRESEAYPDLTVFGACCQMTAIRREADTPDV